MAGIGFELKKMFDKKEILSTLKAYGYAGAVCIGPTILGILLLLGIGVLAEVGGATGSQKEQINSMVTYTLLVSMLITNIFGLVVTRYTADQLYMKKQDKIMPSFFGSVAIMLGLGGILYGIFLAVSGVSLERQVLCVIVFGELVVVWTQMNYLTAIKDYKGILFAFLAAILGSFAIGYLLVLLRVEIVLAMLGTVCIAYGIMMVWYHVLLVRYFPRRKGSAFEFVEWFKVNPELMGIGAALTIGLFGHLVIMWSSPIKKHIIGLFYSAPSYDIPAFLAFISILITTVNFVASVEVRFYPKYFIYFSLFNDGGTLLDIEQAQKEMVTTLIQELSYTFAKQFFTTVVFIVAGSIFLPYLPIGMNEDMLGIYRVLCIGYAFYAVGNVTMLIQLYFSDTKGALISTTAFMVVSCLATWSMRTISTRFYGVGFLLGAMVFAGVALFLLFRYLDQIVYHILCKQPLTGQKKQGIVTRIRRMQVTRKLYE